MAMVTTEEMAGLIALSGAFTITKIFDGWKSPWRIPAKIGAFVGTFSAIAALGSYFGLLGLIILGLVAWGAGRILTRKEDEATAETAAKMSPREEAPPRDLSKRYEPPVG
jgi:hypothetical protein